MTWAFRGIKIGDYVLAAILTTLGVLLMEFDIRSTDGQVARAVADGSMVHAVSSHSLWMIPLFAAATVSVLWWRRSLLAVTGIAIAVMALHDVLFGWETRCGAGLPLALVLVFLAALAYERAKAWLAAGLSALLAFSVVCGMHDQTKRQASTAISTDCEGRMSASCVSLKFAVTHRSSGTSAINCCPGAT